MSVLVIVLIVLGALMVAFFVGGLVVSRRRVTGSDYARHVAAADHALEAARAEDKGWDKAVLDEAARAAASTGRPGFELSELHLVLVDDRPGVVDDRAHYVALGADGSEVRVVLTREQGGAWLADSVA